jgi:hypothetical protein
MNLWRLGVVTGWFAACLTAGADARTWTDTTGRYTLDADLVAFNDKSVVLQRADHELVAVPIGKLSSGDREYLKSNDADALARKSIEAMQTWTLRDGAKVVGRVVDYTQGDMTIQRRRGRIYVNDRPLGNLPEFYQLLVPKIVAHFENLQRGDRQSFETWLVRQRGQRRTFSLEGVVLELENGDEYAVPFFLFSDDDLRVLKPDYDEWLTARKGDDLDTLDERAFLLRSLAAARQRDSQVQRQIATLQLQMQAVQTGLTSLWEVTLYPAAGRGGSPQWVVVPGRDSRQATAAALQLHPGHVVGPVRRVAG